MEPIKNIQISSICPLLFEILIFDIMGIKLNMKCRHSFMRIFQKSKNYKCTNTYLMVNYANDSGVLLEKVNIPYQYFHNKMRN